MVVCAQAKNSVFPPSDFDPETAERSKKVRTLRILGMIEEVKALVDCKTRKPVLERAELLCNIDHVLAGARRSRCFRWA